MTNQQVAEAFANGQSKGKSLNVFIENVAGGRATVIYSYGYHFPMALRTATGIVYLNQSKYSMSTSKQQSYVRRALSDLTLGDLNLTDTEGLNKIIDRI